MYTSFGEIIQKIIRKIQISLKKSFLGLPVSPSDLALLKLTGCLQDAWSSVGCFGDDYHTISEDMGGARRLADDIQSTYQLIFH